MPDVLRRSAVLLPYLAVVVGLFWARNAWVAMLLYHAGMVLVLYAARAWGLARGFLARLPAGWSLLVLCCGLLSGIGLYVLWPWLGVDPRLAAKLGELGFTASSWPVFILYFSLINPWLEELFWRGWLGSPSRGLGASDAWFAGYHILVLLPFVDWVWWLPAGVVLSGASWLWR